MTGPARLRGKAHKSFALVFSGGGARGLSHAGVLPKCGAYEEHACLHGQQQRNVLYLHLIVTRHRVLWNRTTRAAASGDPNEGARLSHTRRTLGDPAPNSLVCSPRRPRRQVFRALFPACDCTLRIVRPSYAGLRPRNNGDRGLGVGTRSALEKQGPQSPSHSSGILPPLG